MSYKLKFNVDNAEVISENPDSNFAILSLDFFASGKNLHDMYVSEETLLKTADTIKNCPLVWKYDKVLDDVYTHDKDEVPCGFVPENTEISSRKLDDGRTMLSAVAYVWKRYTGELLNIFKRDGGKKPVSVEMTVHDTRHFGYGMIELLDYKYEGITILGSYVTPAIPLANASVVSFSELANEYEEDYKKEFGETLWSTPMLVTFPYKSKEDMNPALKGITPPVSVSQANEIAKQADAIGVTEEKNGWAIAISNFKKTHEVKDGKWVKKESKEEMNMDKEEKEESTEEVNMAEENKEEKPEEFQKEEETPSEDKKEEEEEKEEEKEEEVKNSFEFPQNMSLEKMEQMFADEDEDEEVKMAKAEMSKGWSFANPAIVMSGMFAKMCKMAEKMVEMAESNRVYMQENEELKKFKADQEKVQKNFEVERTLKELSDKVILPDAARDEMLAESEKYSFANIGEWVTYCKAKSFDFAIKDTEGTESKIESIGLPFTGDTSSKSDDLWASN